VALLQDVSTSEGSTGSRTKEKEVEKEKEIGRETRHILASGEV